MNKQTKTDSCLLDYCSNCPDCLTGETPRVQRNIMYRVGAPKINRVKLVCPVCRWETEEHDTVAGAIEEWDLS